MSFTTPGSIIIEKISFLNPNLFRLTKTFIDDTFFGGSNEPLLLDAHVPNVLVMIVYKEAKILPL